MLRELRALLRIELRDLIRHRRRSLLLLALVAVPVAAVVAAAVLARSIQPGAEDQRRHALGSAQLRVERPGGQAARDSLVALLPPGTRSERLLVGVESLQAAGATLRARVLGARAEALSPGGLAEGMAVLHEGHWPADAGEVALSPVLLVGLGVARGDSVLLEYGRPRCVTGVVVDPEDTEQPLIVRTLAVVEHPGRQYLLLDGDTDFTALAPRLREAGFPADTRDALGASDPFLALAILALGVVGSFEAALVIAAAFIVGMRRRRREIGLVRSVGAGQRGLAFAMLIATGLLAAVGAALGIALGAGIAALLHPHLDAWNHRLNAPFALPLGLSLVAAAIGVLASLLAVALPARGATRVPVRVALGGRQPAETPTARGLIAGVILLAVGLAPGLLAPWLPSEVAGVGIVVGSVLGIVGLGLCSPGLLQALGRLAGGLPIAWRLALRDAGRFRARNGPVVTAVMAGMAMTVTVALLGASVDAGLEGRPRVLRDDQLLVKGPAAELAAGELARAFGAAAAPLQAVYAGGEPVVTSYVGAEDSQRGWIAAGDEALLRVLGLESGAAALAAGRLLAVDPPADFDDVNLSTWLRKLPQSRLELAPVGSTQRVIAPRFVVSTALAAAVGWELGPPPSDAIAPWLLRLDRPVDDVALAAARKVAVRHPGTAIDAIALHARPANAFFGVVFVLCLLAGLVVLFAAAALETAETAGDRRVLEAVGAAPGLLRRHRAARAATLAQLGSLLALPAGLLPALGLIQMASVPLRLVWPWFQLLLSLLLLPVLVYALSWLAGGGSPRRLAGTLLLALVAAPVGAAPAVNWQPYTGRAIDGSALSGEITHVIVPERHADPEGPSIELAVVRFRSTHPRPGPPILFLAGGPGGSGVEGAAILASHPQIRLLEHADVIGIDQRGTGLSRPCLDGAGFEWSLPLDRPITREDEIAALSGAVVRCLHHWRERGVDLGAYNTRESAEDLESVRRALGLERVILYGTSYGSHLGIAYLREHAEQVARAVLTKVEGPDDTWKLPSTLQARLVELDAKLRGDPALADSIPDLLALLRDLRERMTSEPPTVTVSTPKGDGVAIVLSWHDLQRELARDLAEAPSTAALPAWLLRLAGGDWTELAERSLDARRGNVDSAMAILMDCASGATPSRRARIEQERREPANLLEDAIAAPFYPEVCAACDAPGLGPDFRSVPRVASPVLFVSGTLDARTPPDNVEAILPGFSHGAHVVVENAGHEARELMSREYRSILQGFLRGEPVQSNRLTLPFLFAEPAKTADESP